MPRLGREECLRRFLARDETADGRFIVGVRTTRIYCLPSCPARKPRPENVRFFTSEDEARAAGLRACKRCRPDDFYRDLDPDRELATELAERVRAAPWEFPDAEAMARVAGVGATKLAGIFRSHFHATPAAFLLGARVRAAARDLVGSSRSLLDVALDAGFESSSAFHENFRRRTGMSPGAYRRLGRTSEFVLRLPSGFRREEALAEERRGGPDVALGAGRRKDRLAKALLLEGEPAILELRFAADAVRVRIEAPARPGRRLAVAAHRACVRLLGLEADPGVFERRAIRRGFGRLVRGRRGLRVPQTADPYEGLVWVILGQQVTVSFAAACRGRLIELAGVRPGAGGSRRHKRSAGNGASALLAHPSPAAVAGLDRRDLAACKLSGRKSEYLLDVSRSIASGELDLDLLSESSAIQAEKSLLAVRGLGPWSVNYLLMRSFGLADCVPVGDSGLTAALRKTFELESRPGVEETRALMAPFSPHRSLATYHLWKTLGDTA